MREYKPHPVVFTAASKCMGTQSQACHSGARDFPELRLYSLNPSSLVNLGFHFGRVVMRFVEVACVSTRLTPCFAHVAVTQVGLTLTHATPASVISRSCAFIPELPWV